MFYLTTHSTHFIYGYMASNTQIAIEETRCCHIGYSFRLAARVILYASYHGLCYTIRGALTGTRLNLGFSLICLIVQTVVFAGTITKNIKIVNTRYVCLRQRDTQCTNVILSSGYAISR